MSYAVFWRRNLGFFRLAIITNLEYRVNYLADAVLQPLFSALIELLLWIAVFRSISGNEIAGFSRENYLAYALWGAFVSRITSNWMYEFRMIEDIESGSINGLLVRPASFFEYYLSQFLGYKILTTAVSLVFPIFAAWLFGILLAGGLQVNLQLGISRELVAVLQALIVLFIAAGGFLPRYFTDPLRAAEVELKAEKEVKE